ncbi:hypothetical protein Csa_010243 [Cucumis sativus]|uniref:Uncharacterized protein n=1 Tax=Cucumis sativus TaxID=3659 RepID=A0A0A0L7C0_CUCSA|nr:hypothetical protein Csa_010243 [Cucumis sativus]
MTHTPSPLPGIDCYFPTRRNPRKQHPLSLPLPLPLFPLKLPSFSLFFPFPKYPNPLPPQTTAAQVKPPPLFQLPLFPFSFISFIFLFSPSSPPFQLQFQWQHDA